MGPTPVSQYIFFFLVPNSPKLKNKIKNKKIKNRTANPGKEKEKEKKKNNANPEKKKKNEWPTQEKKKKKKVVKSCGCESLCVFNYNIAIELWVMETENSQKLFSVSITHNSKIR